MSIYDLTLVKLQKEYLRHLATKFEGNRTKMALSMGVTTQTVINQMKKYRLDEEFPARQGYRTDLRRKSENVD